MAKYLVQVRETLQRTYIVEADNKYEAEDIAESAYSESKIILEADDFAENEFIAREVTDEDLSLYSEIPDLW